MRDYTTQCYEANRDFAHRLSQEPGHLYFFGHSKTTHTLVLTDRNQAFTLTDDPTHCVIHESNTIDIPVRQPGALELGPVAPRQVPFVAGALYFEFDRGSRQWQQIQSSVDVAMHVSNDFPDLALQLWAIGG